MWRILLVLSVLCDLSTGDIFEECEGKDGLYVEVEEDCSFYIFCHGEDSFRDSCPEDNPYFSIEDQTCDTNRSVCKDRAVIMEIETSSSASTSSSITTTSAAASSTMAYSSTTFIVASTTTSNSIISTESPLIPTAAPSPLTPSTCPYVDNPNKIIFLPHKKSCSEYFLCYRGERVPLYCSKMLHFDVRQQKCDYPENVKCHLTDVASPREQCLPHTIDFYPHPRNCNYYYQCILGYLKVMQCPRNMGWHYERRACAKRSEAKCYVKTIGK